MKLALAILWSAAAAKALDVPNLTLENYEELTADKAVL
jgi:hypothetical protein